MTSTEKHPAIATRAMIVTNHPLASAAGAEMMAAGGNAIDAAVAALFTLTVVEPMMVGLLGGGFATVRHGDGRVEIVEGQGQCPGAIDPRTFEPDPMAPPGSLDAVGRRNSVGRLAVAVPGTLMAWCDMASRHGRLPLADLIEPAIRHAQRGFSVTSYLCESIAQCAQDLALDRLAAKRFMPGGSPLRPGDRLVQQDVAQTLQWIRDRGAAALYGGGPIGVALCDDMARHGGALSPADLSAYRLRLREPLRFTYRGFDILGPPPPCAGPLHIGQILRLIEPFDLRSMGPGSTQTSHLLIEALKLAFADRAASTADPDFVDVPVDQLLSQDYAAGRRAQFDPLRAQAWAPGVAVHAAVGRESQYTTHVTTADTEGRIVSATQTINSLFGARYIVPDTGLIPNNYLYVLDPRPGRANSLAPHKRVTSSMAPLLIERDGRPWAALGLPGGLRIFPSALQAVVNLIDHGMSLQPAIEAARLWTQGGSVELEPGFSSDVARALTDMGHDIQRVPNVGGGLNAIRFHDDGRLEGAACWRADGTPIGISGGLARPGVRFLPEASPPRNQRKDIRGTEPTG